jgi:hypothetical protein
LFKEIIPIYIENNTEPIYSRTKCRVTDCSNGWYISLPLEVKGLMAENAL